MNLNNLYSSKRTGKDTSSRDADIRSEFQRDFDRIIFSSSFRRLQNKTQVFPLPGSKVFVHNRLTHSLEVASVGRSLGTLIGNHIVDEYAADLNETSKDFYRNSLYNVISSACLCHDIGNPAFGHSGEDAIATFFIKNESEIKSKFESENQWADFINFEGNANAIRILTQQQPGKAIGGLRLTYSTLASIAKYPCESLGKNKGFIHRKKFGFFQSEKETFLSIAAHTAMVKDSDDPVIYFRHPFVWLVEAADDICYNIVDLEDAQRLGIIEYSTCRDILYNLIKDLGNSSMASIDRQLDEMSDKNEHISYLRAVSISILVSNAVEIVKDQGNLESILTGSFKTPMFDMIRDRCKALKDITEFSIEYIYNHRSVVEIENAGYNVMYELLSHFVPSILKDEAKRGQADKKAIRLIPKQYLYDTGTHYQKVMGVLDYVSGMTDNYAADLYKKIKGIEIGMTI